MPSIGDDLLSHARSAHKHAVLIAPFVKRATIERVMAVVPPTAKMDVFTRWRLDEIAAGVSDLDVWEAVCQRPHTGMYLCNHLHAKCYVFDDVALVGSANLTARALQWHGAPNLELVVRVVPTLPEVEDLLHTLGRLAVPVTQGMHEQYRDMLQRLGLRQTAPPEPSPELDSAHTPTAWLPETRHPPQLYPLYSGDWDRVTRSAQRTGSRDLQFLGLPAGLSKGEFCAAIALSLSHEPLFMEINRMAARRRRFGEYRSFMRGFLRTNGIERDAAEAWQTCLRWLLHFMEDEYSVETPRYSEILVQKEKL